MRVAITPEPTPEEREALLRALAAQNGRPQRPSAWWEAGVREAVEDGLEEASVPSAERQSPA
jgi:hypothetical protein